MPDVWYPGADRSQDRSKYSGITMTSITKLVLHSTETAGWPGYPTFAPQITFNPWTGQFRQHMPINRSASTLADPSSTAVRENRDNVVQVEIVGYCDPKFASTGRAIQQMTATGYTGLARLAAWLHQQWGLPLRSTVKWVNYPASYGLRASQRLSGPEYDSYTGILGHQHVSGNDHGDPGVIDAARIVREAQALVTGTTLTAEKGNHLMTEAQPLNRNRTEWQDIPAGDGAEALFIDEPAVAGDASPNSLVVGDTEGADITCTIQVDGLQPGEVAEAYFARYLSGVNGQPPTIDGRYRNPGQVDIIGRVDGKPASNSVRFAGSLKANDPKYRLRVLLNTPRDVRVRMSSRGWVIK